METVLIQLWNIIIRIKKQQYTAHQARSIKGWGAWGGGWGACGGGGYLFVVANIFLNFTYIKVNGHVVGPPLFGENIKNLSESKEKNSEIDVIGIYPIPPPSTQGLGFSRF